MKKENFKQLLEDLYTIYSPANLQYVDSLVERYSRIEFDAVKNIFLKYNRKDAPYYDPALNTDEYIIKLVQEYESGSRVLSLVNLKEQGLKKNTQQQEEQIEIANKKLEEIQKGTKEELAGTKQEIEKNISKRLFETEQQFKDLYEGKTKEIEKYTKLFEEKLKTFEENIQKAEDDCIIRIMLTNSNSELQLPSKKIIAGLGKGSRIVAYDESKKVVGLEIIDITCDIISDINGIPIIEVWLSLSKTNFTFFVLQRITDKT